MYNEKPVVIKGERIPLERVLKNYVFELNEFKSQKPYNKSYTEYWLGYWSAAVLTSGVDFASEIKLFQFMRSRRI